VSALLELQELTVTFPARRGEGPFTAVDGVSLTVARGETLGIVGESGAGKTTLGRAALRLVEPSRGTVRFDGADVGSLGEAGLRRLRRRAQMVFQDPMGSLNPRLRVGQALREVLKVHGTPRERRDRDVAELLRRVELSEDVLEARPHELSGGQCQRVGIARALAVRPELVVLDEPVSALDVSIQAQILNLLLRLQSELALSFLFISHDLAVVHRMSDRILVLREGRVVEEGTPDMVFRQPSHPYTRTLLRAALPQMERG